MGVKLVNNIPRIQREIKVQIAKGINNACQYWAGEAIDLAPELTGELKAGIGQTVTATPASLAGEVRSLANHSSVVNFGSSRQAPQPFWTVAGLLTRQKFDWLLKSGFVGISKIGSAGAGVVRAFQQEFRGR